MYRCHHPEEMNLGERSDFLYFNVCIVADLIKLSVQLLILTQGLAL